MELFRLFGSVMIDDKDAINSLKKVDDKGKSTGQKFADIAKKGALIGAAVIGATAAAGGALLGMAKNTAEATDRIDKMSQKIGLSREGFQEWDFIMSQSGMSVDQLQMGFKTMVNAVDQAIAGSGKGADSFKKLGISVTDANGAVKDQETIFNEAVVALQGMEEGSEKAKLANDLFGRSGAEMMPLLNGAAGSVEEMKKQAHELGLVLDDETIDAGVVFTDTMDQAQRALQTIVTKVGAGVMPAVQAFLEWVIGHMPTIQAVMSTVFGVISTVVSTAVGVFRDYLLPIIRNVADYFRENMPAIREATENAFIAMKEAYENYIKPAFQGLSDFVGEVVDKFNIHLLPAITGFYDWISGNMPAIKQFVSDTFTRAKEVIDQAREAVKTLTDFIIEHWAIFQPILAGVAGAIVTYKLIAVAMGIWTAATGLWTTITGIATGVASAFGAVMAFITSPIGLVVIAIGAAIAIGVALYRNWDTVSRKATELWSAIKTKFNDIKTAIMNPINEAKDAVSNAIEKMKGFFNFNWKLPKIKMPSFSVRGSANPLKWLKEGVPKLSVNWNAAGGIFDKPTIFNTSAGLQGVGEAGPEAIMPLSKLESMLNLNNDKGKEVTVNVNIDTFNNESDRDINALAEKLAFETNRRLSGGGINFA